MNILGTLTTKAAGWLSWKLVAGVVLAAVVYVSVLHVRLNLTQADVKEAKAAFVVAEAANQTLVSTNKELKAANEKWAQVAGMNEQALAQLKKDSENAKRTAERLRQELVSNRELDRRAPDCAALLDRSLAVCPALVKRLRERAAASSN